MMTTIALRNTSRRPREYTKQGFPLLCEQKILKQQATKTKDS